MLIAVLALGGLWLFYRCNRTVSMMLTMIGGHHDDDA